MSQKHPLKPAPASTSQESYLASAEQNPASLPMRHGLDAMLRPFLDVTLPAFLAVVPLLFARGLVGDDCMRVFVGVLPVELGSGRQTRWGIGEGLILRVKNGHLRLHWLMLMLRRGAC